MGIFEKEKVIKKQIGIKQNPHYPGIEVKSGENQYSQHAHIHQAWSFSYILHGKTLVSLGTWKSELTEDQFLAVPSGIPHLCLPDRDNPFSFAVLYIPVEYLDNHSVEYLSPRIGKMDSADLFGFVDLFIQAESNEELNCNSERLKIFLNKNSSPLNAEWGGNLLDNDFTFKYSQRNRFQLYRYSRKLFGIGQKKISTIEKMEEAKKLMAEGLDLVEIALQCGFYDQSHFSKVFKLYTGLTPAQYMKK